MNNFSLNAARELGFNGIGEFSPQKLVASPQKLVAIAAIIFTFLRFIHFLREMNKKSPPISSELSHLQADYNETKVCIISGLDSNSKVDFFIGSQPMAKVQTKITSLRVSDTNCLFVDSNVFANESSWHEFLTALQDKRPLKPANILVITVPYDQLTEENCAIFVKRIGDAMHSFKMKLYIVVTGAEVPEIFVNEVNFFGINCEKLSPQAFTQSDVLEALKAPSERLSDALYKTAALKVVNGKEADLSALSFWLFFVGDLRSKLASMIAKIHNCGIVEICLPINERDAQSLFQRILLDDIDYQKAYWPATKAEEAGLWATLSLFGVGSLILYKKISSVVSEYYTVVQAYEVHEYGKALEEALKNGWFYNRQKIISEIAVALLEKENSRVEELRKKIRRAESDRREGDAAPSSTALSRLQSYLRDVGEFLSLKSNYEGFLKTKKVEYLLKMAGSAYTDTTSFVHLLPAVSVIEEIGPLAVENFFTDFLKSLGDFGPDFNTAYDAFKGGMGDFIGACRIILTKKDDIKTCFNTNSQQEVATMLDYAEKVSKGMGDDFNRRLDARINELKTKFALLIPPAGDIVFKNIETLARILDLKEAHAQDLETNLGIIKASLAEIGADFSKPLRELCIGKIKVLPKLLSEDIRLTVPRMSDVESAKALFARCREILNGELPLLEALARSEQEFETMQKVLHYEALLKENIEDPKNKKIAETSPLCKEFPKSVNAINGCNSRAELKNLALTTSNAASLDNLILSALKKGLGDYWANAIDKILQHLKGDGLKDLSELFPVNPVSMKLLNDEQRKRFLDFLVEKEYVINDIDIKILEEAAPETADRLRNLIQAKKLLKNELSLSVILNFDPSINTEIRQQSGKEMLRVTLDNGAVVSYPRAERGGKEEIIFDKEMTGKIKKAEIVHTFLATSEYGFQSSKEKILVTYNSPLYLLCDVTKREGSLVAQKRFEYEIFSKSGATIKCALTVHTRATINPDPSPEVINL